MKNKNEIKTGLLVIIGIGLFIFGFSYLKSNDIFVSDRTFYSIYEIGIERYAFSLPMDDCLAQVAIDFGGRSWLVWDAEFKREKIGDVPTEMFYHFFKSFCDGAKLNANIKVEGTNEHHKIESIFKAFAKCIKTAISKNKDKLILPSTKGVL